MAPLANLSVLHTLCSPSTFRNGMFHHFGWTEEGVFTLFWCSYCQQQEWVRQNVSRVGCVSVGVGFQCFREESYILNLSYFLFIRSSQRTLQTHLGLLLILLFRWNCTVFSLTVSVSQGLFAVIVKVPHPLQNAFTLT